MQAERCKCAFHPGFQTVGHVRWTGHGDIRYVHTVWWSYGFVVVQCGLHLAYPNEYEARREAEPGRGLKCRNGCETLVAFTRGMRSLGRPDGVHNVACLVSTASSPFSHVYSHRCRSSTTGASSRAQGKLVRQLGIKGLMVVPTDCCPVHHRLRSGRRCGNGRKHRNMRDRLADVPVVRPEAVEVYASMGVGGERAGDAEVGKRAGRPVARCFQSALVHCQR